MLGGAASLKEDRDRVYVVSLASDRKLQEAFESLRNTDHRFGQEVEAFAAMWPIFKVADLRQKGLLHVRPNEPREARISFYLAEGADEFAPECWGRHLAAHERPVDWAHTIAAIYRVRCNLFHGEKAAHSEMDVTVVDGAFRVLMGFIHGAKLLS